MLPCAASASQQPFMGRSSSLMASEPLEVIRRSHAAMNAHDAAGAAMCAAADVEIQGPTGELHGRDAVHMALDEVAAKTVTGPERPRYSPIETS